MSALAVLVGAVLLSVFGKWGCGKRKGARSGDLKEGDYTVVHTGNPAALGSPAVGRRMAAKMGTEDTAGGGGGGLFSKFYGWINGGAANGAPKPAPAAPKRAPGKRVSVASSRYSQVPTTTDDDTPAIPVGRGRTPGTLPMRGPAATETVSRERRRQALSGAATRLPIQAATGVHQGPRAAAAPPVHVVVPDSDSDGDDILAGGQGAAAIRRATRLPASQAPGPAGHADHRDTRGYYRGGSDGEGKHHTQLRGRVAVGSGARRTGSLDGAESHSDGDSDEGTRRHRDTTTHRFLVAEEDDDQ